MKVIADQGTILVVDDSPDSLALQVELLAQAGFGVRQAVSGPLGLAAALAQPPDLILLDVFMDGMDGFEVCRQLKAREEVRHIPVILVSAFAGVKALEQGLRLGAADYLAKPFQPEELLARVQTHLSLGRANAALGQQVTALRVANEQLQIEIKERQRAEEDVIRLAREWQITFGATNDAIWLLDANQQVVRANKMADELFPRPCGKQHCWSIVHGTDGPISACPVQRARKTLRRETMELQVGERWYQVTADPILDEARQFVGAVHIVRDITERKQAQAVMAARLRLMCLAPSHSLAELLRATLDEAEALTHSQVGFYHFVDPDQIGLSLQVWSSHTSLHMCKAEGTGLHYPIDRAGVWVDCIRERRPVIHNDYASLPHRKGLPEGHAPILRELVVPVWRNRQMVAVLGVGNKPSNYDDRDVDNVASLADLAWDIAENKRKEEALAKSQRLLAETEKVGNVGGWEFDVATGKQSWTDEVFRIHELDLNHQPTLENGLVFYTPASRPIIETAVQRAAEKGDPFDVELEIITAKGNLRSIHAIGKADLEHHRVYGFLQDITAQKLAQAEKEKLEALNRQLQKSESLGRMAGAIAHHFNNQLQSVMMSLELARISLPHNSEGAEELSAALASADKAASVSRTMLTYLGQNQAKRARFDLSEICQRYISMLRVVMPPCVVLATDLPSPGPVVFADANQIQQILANLVTNAWESLGDQNGAVHLRVKTVATAEIPASPRFPIECQLPDPAYACLEVTDTGCGILARDVEKLFDPFFSTKFAGRGLGLPVVLGIVRTHGGAVTVKSTLGRGSVFQVLLPLAPATLA